MRPFSLLLPIFTFVLLAASASYASARSGATAENVYQKVRPAVFQIKTAVNADAPKASYGTGFAISANGELITNFHVVASTIHKDKDYKLFLVDGDENLPLKILAVDVVHDLALVQVEKKFKDYIKLSPKMPKQGEKIFPVGLPEDLNMSLSEGLYNDILSHGPYRKIHMSAPLNSGMSGGPTVNAKAEVVGVNVSVKFFSQNLSFSVPIEFVEKIIAKANSQSDAPSLDAIHKDIEKQLLEVDKQLVADYQKTSSKQENLDGWAISSKEDFLKCWQVDRNHDQKKYLATSKQCYLQGAAYLHESNYAGTYSISYQTYTSKKLNWLQMFRIADSYFSSYSANRYLGDSGKNYLLTNYECDYQRVKNEHGIQILVNYCIQGYLDYPNIRNLFLKLFAPHNSERILAMSVSFRGIDKNSIGQLLENSINRVRLAEDNEDSDKDSE